MRLGYIQIKCKHLYQQLASYPRVPMSIGAYVQCLNHSVILLFTKRLKSAESKWTQSFILDLIHTQFKSEFVTSKSKLNVLPGEGFESICPLELKFNALTSHYPDVAKNILKSPAKVEKGVIDIYFSLYPHKIQMSKRRVDYIQIKLLPGVWFECTRTFIHWILIQRLNLPAILVLIKYHQDPSQIRSTQYLNDTRLHLNQRYISTRSGVQTHMSIGS